MLDGAWVDKYHNAIAKAIGEASKLIGYGFEYVTELGDKLFREYK